MPKPCREQVGGRAVAARPLCVLLFAAVLAAPVVPPVSAQSPASASAAAGSSIVQGRSYVVTPKAANVRPRPSTDAAAVAWLRRGTRVRVISGPAGDGDWRRVEREGQPVGYVHVSVLATEADAVARGRAVLRDAFDRLRDARFDEAVELFEDGLALAPGSGVATFYLGESLFALARFDEAANNYRRVLELAPGTEEERRARLRLRDLDAPNAVPPPAAASPRVAANPPPAAVPPTASPRAAASAPAASRPATSGPAPTGRDAPLAESRPSAAAPGGAASGATAAAPAAEPPPAADVKSSLRLFAAARELAAATVAPGGRFSGLLNVASLQTRAGATPDVAVTLAAAEPVVAEMVESAEPERRPEMGVVAWGAIAGLQCRAGLREDAAASLEREAVAAGDDLELLARALTTRWQCGLPAAAETMFERIEALDAAVAVQEGEPADERQSLLARRLAIQGAFPWALRVMRRVEDNSWRWLAVNAIVLQLRRHGHFEEAAALAADPTADIDVGETAGKPSQSLLRSTRLNAGEMETAFRRLVIRADRAFEAVRPEVARAALARAELAARAPVLAARRKDFLAVLTGRFAELGDADTVVRIDKELADPEPVPDVRADLVLAHALAGNLSAAADVAAPLRGEAGMHGGIAVVRGLVRAEEVDLARALAEQLEGDIAAVEPPPVRARFLAELGRAYREVEAAERK